MVNLLKHGGQIEKSTKAKPNDQINRNSLEDKKFFIVMDYEI